MMVKACKEPDCRLSCEAENRLTGKRARDVEWGLSQVPNGVILDAGCGYGWLTSRLLATSQILVSIDLVGERLRENPHKAETSLTQGDLSLAPFTDGVFDGIFCHEVFEHVENPQEVLAEFFRILKPGGTLVLIAPTLWFRKGSLLLRLQKALGFITGRSTPTHIKEKEYVGSLQDNPKEILYLTNPYELKRILSSLGFHVDYNHWWRTLLVARK